MKVQEQLDAAKAKCASDTAKKEGETKACNDKLAAATATAAAASSLGMGMGMGHMGMGMGMGHGMMDPMMTSSLGMGAMGGVHGMGMGAMGAGYGGLGSGMMRPGCHHHRRMMGGMLS